MKFLIILLIIPAFSCGGKKPILKPIPKPINIKEVICLAAKEKKVDCRIMDSIARTESNHENIDSKVDHDSTGIFQIRPSTAEDLLWRLEGIKRKVTKKELRENMFFASQIAVLRLLDCRRAFKESIRQIRVREIICFNRGPSGTWKAVRWYGNLKVLTYWKRYSKHWIKFKKLKP